jgi:putative colanic acid biosynthesis acetyltransferase WcaF
LFKRGKARYEERPVHEHMIVDGPTGFLKGLMDHEDRRGLEFYIAKHNRYSTLEAEVIHHLKREAQGALPARAFGNAVERRRFFRDKVYPKVPARWVWRFLWMYVIKLGFLDGMTGLRFCLLISTHEMFTSLKVVELQMREKSALAAMEGETTSRQADFAQLTTPLPAACAPPSLEKEQALRREQAVNREPSTWTFRQKVNRVLWMFVSATLFRLSFHNWYAWRRMLLRLFGARVGSDVRIRPSVSIEIPWNLEIADGAVIGDSAILYALGKIRIGRDAVISQYAHLCAGTHDYNSRRFPLVRMPITIGNEAWVAADAFVGPGVTVGDRAVVGARSTVVKDVPANQVVVGSPAKYVKERVLAD